MYGPTDDHVNVRVQRPEMNNSRGASERAWPRGDPPPPHSPTTSGALRYFENGPAQPLHGYYATRRYYSSLHAEIFLRTTPKDKKATPRRISKNPIVIAVSIRRDVVLAINSLRLTIRLKDETLADVNIYYCLLTLLVVARQSVNQLIMIYKYRDMKRINIEILKVKF